MLEPAIKELATTNKNFAALSFHLPSGHIATHMMWVDASDDHLLVNTEVHRVKYEAMSANPVVTVTLVDAANPYHYGEVRGRIVDEVRGDEARAHIDSLAQKYMGKDYPGKIESERVILRIEPVRQRIWGG